MIAINPQYVVDDEDRRQAVLLTVAEWQQIVDALEELDDIRAYDAAKQGDQAAVPFEQAVREINEEPGA